MSAITEAVGLGLKLFTGSDVVANSPSYTEVTGILDFQPPELTYSKIDTTVYSNSTGVRTSKGGLGTPGTGKVTILWQPTLIASLRAMGKTKFAFKITYGDGIVSSVAIFDGHWAKIADKTPIDDNDACDLEYQQDAAATFTAGNN